MSQQKESDVITQRVQIIHDELKQIRAAKLYRGTKMWAVTDHSRERYERQLLISLQEYQKLLTPLGGSSQ